MTYILSKPTKNWKYCTGHVDTRLLSTKLPKPSLDVLIYVCGPPGFMQSVSGDKTGAVQYYHLLTDFVITCVLL